MGPGREVAAPMPVHSRVLERCFRPHVLAVSIVALSSAAPALAVVPPPGPKRTQPVSGVHVFESPKYSDVGLDGNSVAIITSEGVVVFDANGTPEAARAVLQGIRKITKQPVRYLVLSHWHWDHWYGAEVYAKEFPGLVIVAHEKSRALMAGPAVEFNQPGLDAQLPMHIEQMEKVAETARRELKHVEATRFEAHAAEDRKFLLAKRTAKLTLPTKTFTDSLDLTLGGRRILVRHPGRAITPGDAYLHLPDDRLLVTGDLLVNPITFALFCDPSGWISALEQLDAKDATWIVPGHGAPLKGEQLLHDTRELLVRQRQLALALKREGRSVEEAKADVLRDEEVRRLREAIVGLDPNEQSYFDLYLVDWFVRRVYDEADGKIDDRIPAMP
jgi:glyoxylase-like metal-dependent hydrolase (beta-lactamase superfamily II)